MEESLPLYQSVAKEIMLAIHEGVYPRGTFLPTEEKLLRRYNVSRVTIRKSLEILVENRYIQKKQGSGSKVIYSKRNPITDKSIKVMSFEEEMKALNKKPSKKILHFEVIPATAEIASKLGIARKESVYYYERLMCGDSFPYSFERGYIPTEEYPDFSVQDLMESKFYYFEQKKQKKIKYSEQNVRAILANKRLAESLHVDKGSPLIRLDLTTYLEDDSILEWNTIIFDTNNYQANFIKYR